MVGLQRSKGSLSPMKTPYVVMLTALAAAIAAAVPTGAQDGRPLRTLQHGTYQCSLPGDALNKAGLISDEDLDGFIRAHAESAYHPCGTARMGRRDDPMTVIDSECRVIGVDGLRVADSSVFPRITNGNLNAPSIMVGEKAADHILGKTPLAPSNAEPWVHPDWQTAQR